MVVDGEGLVCELVRHLDPEKRGPRRDVLLEDVAEVAGEKEAERAVRERELRGSARDRAVEPLRLEDDPVRLRELSGELRHLRGRIGLVEPEVDDRIALRGPTREREREPLVPVLLQDVGAFRYGVVEPAGSRHRAVGARVDRDEGERPDGRPADDGGPQDPSAAPALRLAGEPRAGPEQEDRVHGKQVAGELHLERAGDEDVGHEEGREHPLARPERPDAGEARERRPERRDPEEGSEPPEDELLALVKEVGHADVLVREREDAGVTDHRALLRDRAPELARVEEGVRLAEREGDQGRGAGGGEQRGRAAERTAVLRREEDRDGERKEKGCRARLRREREARHDAREDGVAQAAAVRESRRAREREEDEEREGDVGRREVRCLDMQDREGEQESREEARFLAVPAPPEEREEEHGEGAPDGREKAPDVDHPVVGREPRTPRDGGEGRRHHLRDVERERAVREEVRVQRERPERDLEDRVADRALVRMVEVPLVEVEPHDPHGGREDEDEG